MSITKFIVSLGIWLEKHFPEKMTVQEVNERICLIESCLQDNVALTVRLSDLEKKTEVMTSDINKMKVMLLSQRAGR